ncbi:hypothetical protein chiPu_0024754, partial [Chiloscyllium punctatum]|nr:hypothetical protein [Chiloscyllium punctatum]
IPRISRIRLHQQELPSTTCRSPPPGASHHIAQDGQFGC